MFDGVEEECTVTIDRNGEYLCEAPSGRFAKFGKQEDLEEAAQIHNEVYSEIPEIIPEVTYGEVTTFDENGNEIK